MSVDQCRCPRPMLVELANTETDRQPQTCHTFVSFLEMPGLSTAGEMGRLICTGAAPGPLLFRAAARGPFLLPCVHSTHPCPRLAHHSIPVHAKTTPVSSVAVVTHRGKTRLLLLPRRQLHPLSSPYRPPDPDPNPQHSPVLPPTLQKLKAVCTSQVKPGHKTSFTTLSAKLIPLLLTLLVLPGSQAAAPPVSAAGDCCISTARGTVKVRKDSPAQKCVKSVYQESGGVSHRCFAACVGYRAVYQELGRRFCSAEADALRPRGLGERGRQGKTSVVAVGLPTKSRPRSCTNFRLHPGGHGNRKACPSGACFLAMRTDA